MERRQGTDASVDYPHTTARNFGYSIFSINGNYGPSYICPSDPTMLITISLLSIGYWPPQHPCQPVASNVPDAHACSNSGDSALASIAVHPEIVSTGLGIPLGPKTQNHPSKAIE